MQTWKIPQLPLCYTHGIGSLPRPDCVRDLVSGRVQLAPEDRRRVMDEMVVFAIRLQELAGMDVVSDGEWRRVQYVDEFLDRLGGFPPVRKYEHQGETKFHRVAVARVAPKDPVFTADGEFLVRHTRRFTKFALPSPFLIAIRYWNEDYSRDAYPTYRDLMDHLAEVLAIEARALVDAGIDIIQIDDPALTYFCDRQLMAGESSHDARLRRDWDVDTQFPQAIAAINRVTEGLNAEIHLHCCHSVYKRRADVSGDYKPILPRLGELKADRVNLEFAYAGTGEISDLHYLPQHLGVGLGIVDVRGERLQSVEEMLKIAEAGMRVVGPERLALNPDCGFAPNSAEPPSIDEAYEKLRRLVAAAAQLRASIPEAIHNV